MADNSREVRDIGFPKPPKKEPELSPLRKSALPRRGSSWRNKAAWLALALLLLVAISFAPFFGGSDNDGGRQSRYSWAGLESELRKGMSAYSELKNLSALALDLAGLMEDMQKKIPDFMAGQASLTDPLRDLRGKLDGIMSAFDRIVMSDSSLKDKMPFFSTYMSWRGGLDRGKEMLEASITLLEKGSPTHIIVILGNTSELRPGSGFVGSFADIEIDQGALRDITVRDINEVDRARDRLVIPPKPLQAIAGRWRIADANWFFDYPTSARKITQFMGESEIYATTSIDVVVAITPRIMRDVLEVTGPMRLADGTEVGSGNFIQVIQREVQEGQASGADDPKFVLRELAPMIRDRLASLSGDEQGKIIEKIPAWVAAKDLMVFSPHEKMAKALAGFGADGSLHPVTGDADYLGIANANIGGGKTDIYMEQKAKLESHIDGTGAVRNTLSISRRHKGDKESEWWYRETNWTYLKIFTPPGALPEDMQGFGTRHITPKADYRKGYEADPDVAAIEASTISSEDGRLQVMKESGKNVFGTWHKVAAGESKELRMIYSRKMSKMPSDGKEYTFVFERQAGADISLEASFTAPLGYVWAENDSPVFEYRKEAPEGRTVIRLTFKKAH